MADSSAINAARARLAQRAGVSMASIDKAAQRGAPTKEEGSPGVISGMGGFAFGGKPDWAYFIDTREQAPELQWPASIPVLERMETDAQLKGLLLATTLPVRRFRWELDPNEADPMVVEHAAEDLNLPIRGEDPQPRRGGVNHDQHMAHALRGLSQGHYHFEEVVELREDGLLHLVKLGTRPPHSIVGIRTDEHGMLEAIEQIPGGLSTGGRILGGLGAMGIRTLKADRLLTYVWDARDDGDQVGNSLLRPTYRNWLVKDALIRVDAVKHERNAMGIPWFEVDPGASKEQIDSLAQRAEEIRASSAGGGAGPGKLRIAGVEGTLPDTIASIRYHDEQMSKALMLLLFNLGGDARTGARALGETFVDTYLEAQATIADWYAEKTQALIDRQVERNWGPDERVPLLTYTRIETAALAFKDLAEGVEKGLIAVDEELRAYIGERWKLPGQEGPIEPPVSPSAAPQPLSAPEPSQAPIKTSEGRSAPRPKRSALAEKMATSLTAPMTWPQLARLVGSDPKNGTARRARDQLITEGAILKNDDGTLLPAVAMDLPDRELKRAPLPFEVAAGVNFAAMELTFLEGRSTLVDAYKQAQPAQITELAAAVEAAKGNAAALASLSCAPVDIDFIEGALLKVAAEGIDSAKAEHEVQMGVSAAEARAALDRVQSTPLMIPGDAQAAKAAVMALKPASFAEADESRIQERIRSEAEAVATVLASGLGLAASKRASALRDLPPAEAAQKVGEYLSGLSDAELEKELGGATTHAMGIGRQEYQRANDPKAVFSSEILDSATCAECNSIDGTEYPSVAASEGDYPSGAGFTNCEAGIRCRGVAIAEY